MDVELKITFPLVKKHKIEIRICSQKDKDMKMAYQEKKIRKRMHYLMFDHHVVPVETRESGKFLINNNGIQIKEFQKEWC